MNCCDSFGRCTQGPDCPVREAAHTKAAEKHFAPAYPLHIEMFDAPGNAWDRMPWYGKALFVLGAVLACALVAPLVVPK